MRILLVNQFYPPDVAPTGQFLRDVAVQLADRGHEVHVLASRRAYSGGTHAFPAEEVRDAARVHRVSATGFGRAGLAGRAADYLSFYLLAARRVAQLPRMDVCVCLTTPPFISLLGAGLRRLRGARLVLWTMDLYPEIAVAFGLLREGGYPHRLLRAVAGRVYRAADAVVSLGEVMTQRLTAAGVQPEKIVTVHHWAPGEGITPHEGATGGPVTLLYSGNLGLGHELETALEAVAALPNRDGIRLRFVGEGKLKKILEDRARRLGLSCVTFAPPYDLANLSENLAGGDIHLISQRPGTQGLIVPSKLYGSLAAGRAVLYIGPSDTEVARIVHEARAGLIVAPGDVPAAAEALRKMIDDPEQRRTMGRRGRDYYLEHFGRLRGTARIADAIEAVGKTQGGRL
jgi:colanic acid biosynthesis glycosyl transferase WcaI